MRIPQPSLIHPERDAISWKQTLLIVLLLIFSIASRLHFDHQVTFDSFPINAMANSLVEKGYADWVLHPASLFGYYPFSYPSATYFFLGTFTSLLGILTDQAIIFMALGLAVLGIIGVFVLAREFGSFLFAFITALMFSVAPYFVLFTSWNASARIMLIVMYPLLMWLLIRSFCDPRRLWYASLAAVTIAFTSIVHRMFQFILIILFAYILTVGYFMLPTIWGWFQKTKIHALLIRRYSMFSLKVILDIGILIGVLVIAKILDLISRNRLLINLNRMQESWMTRIDSVPWESVPAWGFTAAIIISTLTLVVLIHLIRNEMSKKKLGFYKLLDHYTRRTVRLALDKPDFYLSLVLVMVIIYFFVGQFVGSASYTPSLTDYYESQFLAGRSPPIIFFNFVLNYMTTVNLLVLLVPLGLLLLIFKKHKSFPEMFLLIITIGFSQFLIDKNYVRSFIIPLLSIYISIVLVKAYNYFMHRERKLTAASWLGVLIIATIVSSNVIIHREFFFNEPSVVYNYDEITASSTYINGLDLNSSILVDDGMLASVIIYAQTGIPSTPFNVLEFGDLSKLKPIRRSNEEIKRMLLDGELKELWIIPDWITPGTYYWGRHGIFVYERSYTDPLVKKLMREYKEEYYIRDKYRKPTNFFISIEPIKNKIYDNPAISMWDLQRGR
ncbi:hypothetical protein JXB02_02165 [Candidatus Woesearchaeota archaeon]|nr:hypothetical protein [Candidatus Woesearchaeota archaeon]